MNQGAKALNIFIVVLYERELTAALIVRFSVKN